jgi:hypothetical protein
VNWLDICRRVRKECGLSGTDTSPTSVIGQSGEMLAVVNWVGSAWLAIQSLRKWDWLWEIAPLTLAADANTIAGTVSHERYAKDSMMAGERELTYLPWPQFRARFQADEIVDGDPQHWTVRPDRTLVFDARPDAEMSLTVERYAAPAAMPTTGDADTEEPVMPADQHEAIVWRAVMFYAGFDEASALYQHAKTEYRRIMGSAEIDGLPTIELGASLA